MTQTSISPQGERSFTDLLAAARCGETSARNALFDRFYARVQQMVHVRLASDLRRARPWLARRFSTGDVVQDVFWSVLKDPTGFSGSTEGAFAGYLAIVVRNRIVDAVRFHEACNRDGRRSQEPVDRTISEDHEPSRTAIATEELESFHRALAALDVRERLLLRERLEDGASFAELADSLGFANKCAARRAFFAARARLTLMLRPA